MRHCLRMADIPSVADLFVLNPVVAGMGCAEPEQFGRVVIHSGPLIDSTDSVMAQDLLDKLVRMLVMSPDAAAAVVAAAADSNIADAGPFDNFGTPEALGSQNGLGNRTARAP